MCSSVLSLVQRYMAEGPSGIPDKWPVCQQSQRNGGRSKMMRLLVLSFFMLAWLTACARHRQANSNCAWPNETGAEPLNLNDPSQRQQLGGDAEFAEDLAIRYADAHWGLHTRHFEGIAEYERARNECMAGLFKAIGSSHDVTEEEVRRSLGHRRGDFDLAVVLSFSLFYAWGTSVLARWLYRLYAPGEELTTVLIMTAFASLIASTAGVMLGEVWSGILEAYRIGNGHMSYRFARIPWTHHRLGLFIGGVVLFWLVAASQRRNVMTARSRASLELARRTGTKA